MVPSGVVISVVTGTIEVLDTNSPGVVSDVAGKSSVVFSVVNVVSPSVVAVVSCIIVVSSVVVAGDNSTPAVVVASGVVIG